MQKYATKKYVISKYATKKYAISKYAILRNLGIYVKTFRILSLSCKAIGCVVVGYRINPYVGYFLQNRSEPIFRHLDQQHFLSYLGRCSQVLRCLQQTLSRGFA